MRSRLALLLFLAGCVSGAGPLEIPPDTVVIQAFAFAPQELSVSTGTEVTWTNQEEGVAHTATARRRSWDSGLLQPGDFYSFTFAEPGTYAYFCSIHPRMRGTIVVGG